MLGFVYFFLSILVTSGCRSASNFSCSTIYSERVMNFNFFSSTLIGWLLLTSWYSSPSRDVKIELEMNLLILINIIIQCHKCVPVSILTNQIFFMFQERCFDWSNREWHLEFVIVYIQKRKETSSRISYSIKPDYK